MSASGINLPAVPSISLPILFFLLHTPFLLHPLRPCYPTCSPPSPTDVTITLSWLISFASNHTRSVSSPPHDINNIVLRTLIRY
eukprot:752657-Hanusia_phi.AAC.4